jgi:hypothetical protein
VILHAEYGPQLPLWGDWPRDTPLPENLRRQLTSWQQEFEKNMPGWRDGAGFRQWMRKRDVLAESLRELLDGRATLEVPPF